MSMEVTAWNAMYNAMDRATGQSAVLARHLRRVGGYARPHRRHIAWYLVLSVVTAALAVATPILAGRVVDAIVPATRPRWWCVWH